MNGIITNITNVVDTEKDAFAEFRMTGKVLGGAEAWAYGSAEPFSKRSTFDLNLAVENVDVPNVNPWLREYLKADAKSGEFDLYLEVASSNGRYEGFAKPMLENVQFLGSEDLPTENPNPLEEPVERDAPARGRDLREPAAQTGRGARSVQRNGPGIANRHPRDDRERAAQRVRRSLRALDRGADLTRGRGGRGRAAKAITRARTAAPRERAELPGRFDAERLRDPEQPRGNHLLREQEREHGRDPAPVAQHHAELDHAPRELIDADRGEQADHRPAVVREVDTGDPARTRIGPEHVHPAAERVHGDLEPEEPDREPRAAVLVVGRGQDRHGAKDQDAAGVREMKSSVICASSEPASSCTKCPAPLIVVCG